jgi:hypothetical protein
MYPVDPVSIVKELVVIILVGDNEYDQQAGRHTGCETEDIDQAEAGMFTQASPGG